MAKRLFIFILLVLLPTIIFAQEDNREFTGWQWYDDGISFSYSVSVAENAVARFVPVSVDAPESVQIVFENYHGDTGWIATGAEIHIMPVSTLPERMLAVWLTLDGLPEVPLAEIQTQLPSLIQSDSSSVTVAQANYFRFQSGFGLRFIAFTQDAMNAVNLSYWFLGKTTDNNYLIVARFPLTASNFDSQSLENLSDFSPTLEILDSLLMSLNVSPPNASFLTSQTNGQLDYEGIRFTYDNSLAYRVEVDTVAPITGSEAEQTMFGVTPGYQRFTFVGFPAFGSIQSPHLYLMPVAEFPNEDQIYGERLVQLQTLLCEHPELSAAADPGGQNPLPILPVMNAAQTIVSQPQYLNFSNGQGLRYITYYSQGINFVTATDLFYTFVGISTNGQYVLAATFPLYAPFLPQSANDIANYDDFAVNYQTYLDGLLLQIDVMDGSAYMPQIQHLDALISSVSVPNEADSAMACALELP